MAVSQIAAGVEVGMLPLPTAQMGEPIKLPGSCWLQGPQRIQRNPWFVSREWISRIKSEFGAPDIVHFHTIYIPFNSALARRCREVGWPYVVTAHGGLSKTVQKVSAVKKNLANFLCFRSYLRHAAAIHALCENEAKDILADFDVKKVFVVPNGIDEHLLDASKTLKPAYLGDFGKECDLILGFVGRIDIYHKGIDILLQAMGVLKSQSVGLKWKLFMIGSFRGKKDEQFFCSTIRSLGLENEVIFLGPRYGEEKLRYMRAFDIFVHTSRYEGMPMTVLEAMALGLPCLVTPATNMADVVSEAGGWVAEGQPDAIAKAIQEIYNSRASLPAIGKNTQNLACLRFDWHTIARQLKNEYTIICNDRT